jgi:hypothetical protein
LGATGAVTGAGVGTTTAGFDATLGLAALATLGTAALGAATEGGTGSTSSAAGAGRADRASSTLGSAAVEGDGPAAVLRGDADAAGSGSGVADRSSRKRLSA